MKDNVTCNTVYSLSSVYDALLKSVEANDENGFVEKNISSEEIEFINKYHKFADDCDPVTFRDAIEKVNHIMYDLMNLAWDVDRYKMQQRIERIEKGLKEVISPNFSFGCDVKDFDFKYRHNFHLISICNDKVCWGDSFPGEELEIEYNSIEELLKKVQEVYDEIKGYYDLSKSLAEKINKFIGKRGKLAEVRFYMIMNKLGVWKKYDEWYKFIAIENDFLEYYWDSDDCGSGHTINLKKKIDIYKFDKEVDEISESLIGKLFKK